MQTINSNNGICYKNPWSSCTCNKHKPLIPRVDEHVTSPNNIIRLNAIQQMQWEWQNDSDCYTDISLPNIHTIPSRQVTRKKRDTN